MSRAAHAPRPPVPSVNLSSRARSRRGLFCGWPAPLLAGLLFLIGTGLPPGHAQTLYWDSNTSNDGVQDGGGTWSTSNTNWLPAVDSSSANNQSWPSGATGFDTTAVFGNGGVLTSSTRTVTVSGTLNVGGITFKALQLTSGTEFAYRLSGGTLQLKDGGVIEIDQGASTTNTAHRITIASTLAGSNAIIRKTVGSSDLGLLQLEGSNTWTGTLGLEGALFVDVRNIASINTLGAIQVGDGGTLVINYSSGTLNVPLTLNGIGNGGRGAIRFDQNRTLAGAVTLASTAGIAAVNGAVGTISGDIGESGGSQLLRINTASTTGTVVLSGNNTFTGGVEIVSGTLRIGSTGALNSTAPNVVTFTNNTNGKTLALNGLDTVVGGLVNAGGTGATVQNASGTAAQLIIRNDVERTYGGGIADGTGGGALTLVKEGAGRQILSGTSSTYTGGTLIKEGILRIAGDGSLGAQPGAPDPDNITFNGGTLQIASSFNLHANRGITVQAGGGTFDVQNFTSDYAGALTGSGVFNKTGTGTLVLSGSSDLTGEIRVLQGVLAVSHANALGGTTGATVVSTGARLELRDGVTVTGETVFTPHLTAGPGFNTWAGTVRGQIGATVTIETLNGDLLITGPVNASSSDGLDHTLTLTGSNYGEITGTISNTITLNKTGTGIWRLGGNNTFTGGLTISAGTVILAHSGALNASAPNVVTFANTASDKTLALQGTSVTAAGLVTAGGAGIVVTENGGAADAVLTLSGSGSYTYGGYLMDGGGGGRLALTKDGTGTQTLTFGALYTGNTTVRKGVLQLDFNAAGAPTSNILGSSSTLVMAGGTLSVLGSGTSAVSQTVNGLVVAGGSSTISLTTNATPQDVALSLGSITRTSGSINFILPAGATSAANGITTTATNTNGILGAWATVNGSDWAAVSSGNIVAYTGYTEVTNFGTGAGAIGPIPDDPSANIKIVAGGVSGPVLLADNGADGVTGINSLVQTAAGGATISFGGTPAGKILRLGASGGVMVAHNAGNLVIGSTADEDSILTAGGAPNTSGEIVFINSTDAPSISTNAVITVNSDINDNGSGVVSLSKEGNGLLILTSTGSTYSGGTTINGGVIRIHSDRSLGAVPGSFDADNITLNGGALHWGASFNLSANRGITLLAGGGTLDTTSNSTTYSGVISGSGDLIKAGSGTLTLTTANLHTGATLVTNGTIVVLHNQALGSATGETRVATAGMLRLGDGIIVSGESLTINGGGANNNGNLQVVAGTSGDVAEATWAGNVVIGTSGARVGTLEHSTLTITGVISNGAGNALGISASATGGTVVLAAQNTYTGSTSIIRGTLRLGIEQALSAASILHVHSTDATADMARVDLAGFNQTVAGLRGESRAAPTATNKTTVTNSSPTAATLTVDQSTDSVYYGEITGNLHLVKAGTGTLTLENQNGALTNSYTGHTTITGGTLALRNNGNLDGTPWVRVDSGALLSIAQRTGGGYAFTNKVLSGTGAVDGTLTVSGTSVIRPGTTGAGGTVADAGAGFGELAFTNLTIAPKDTGMSARVYLQLGGTNSLLSDPLAGGDATYFANAGSGGLYDSLQINGTLGLNQGSTIQVTFAEGYTASVGDVFNLIDWATLNLDADGAGGAGAFTLADLDISGLNVGPGNFINTDLFLSHGIIYVAPEPGRALLLMLGLVATLGRRRRTRQPTGGTRFKVIPPLSPGPVSETSH